MVRDGYHIHTILNSKALPKLEDQMTLAAAAVPLTLTHSTVPLQGYPSKHAQPHKCNPLRKSCKLHVWKKKKKQGYPKSLCCIVQRKVQYVFRSRVRLTSGGCHPAAGPSFMKSWGYSCHKGNLQDPSHVCFGSQPTVLETSVRDK